MYLSNNNIYIVDAARTPFLKVSGQPLDFSACDLALAAASPIFTRNSFNPKFVDEVIAGCMMPSADEANIARIIALRLGCQESTPAWTVQRNCGSGLQAIDAAISSIALKRADVVLAGGCEAMSRAPLLVNNEMVSWLTKFASLKTIASKGGHLLKFKLAYLKPVIALLRGLRDPVKGINMGQTAQELAYKFDIDRYAMDEYAIASHNLAFKAKNSGLLEEIVPLISEKGEVLESDTGVREEVDIDKMASLRPVFDKYGDITAGNSSQISDGAAFMLLCSEDAVKKHNLKVIGKIKDITWSALQPEFMGLGPVHAITKILTRNNLSKDDIDYFEINEAFAAQVLACQQAFEDEAYCLEHLGLDKRLGKIDTNKLNVNGGAISIGHPVSASGARITMHLLNTLHAKGGKYGIASLCVGGGQGGAILVERASGVSE